jgi:patatin-like phospholipase/acyl hydrolase
MTDSNTVIALFTYGGGMRGLIPAYFMAKIEDMTGLRMAEMVDIFTGPSTGAILNAALNVPSPENPAVPKYRARQMIKFYEREGKNIFPQDRFRDFRGLIHDFNNRTMKIGRLKSLFRHGHYKTNNLSHSLRALYGDAKLSDSLRSLVIPVYNLDGEYLKVLKESGENDDAPVRTKNNLIDEGGHAVWLKNMKTGININPTPDVSIYDSVLASCAAPTFFPCHHFTAQYQDRTQPTEFAGIDGSIFDNPCISYHGAIRQHLAPGTKLIMIILGTGHTRRSIRKDDWNRYGGLGVVDPANDLPLINILFHASETALIESFSAEMGENVFVFNKSLIPIEDNPDAPSTEIDDASADNLANLYRFFEETLEENKAQFEQVCNLLVQNRDQRQKSKGSFLKKLVGRN